MEVFISWVCALAAKFVQRMCVALNLHHSSHASERLDVINPREISSTFLVHRKLRNS